MLATAPLGYAQLDRAHWLTGNPKLDVQHYRISIDASKLDFTNGFCSNYELPVTTEVTLVAKAEAPSIDLHFNSHASRIESVREAESGEELKYDIRDLLGGHRYVAVHKLLADKQTLRLKFETRIVSADVGKLPFGGYFPQPFNCSTNRLFLDSYAYNFRSFAPSNDIPADGATNEFIIRTPLNAVAAANGRLIKGSFSEGEVDAVTQTRVFHWHQRQPVSTSVMSFVIALRNGVPTEAGVYKGRVPVVAWDGNLKEEHLGWLHRSTELLEEFIGPYPFDKLGIMSDSGGMEYANLMRGNFRHELIHQWWGNTVRPETFGDGWISEGFTTYFDEVISSVVNAGGSTSQLDQMYPPCGATGCSKLNGSFDQVNLLYGPGAHCLHRLRALVRANTNEQGPLHSQEAFFVFMRAYYHRHRGDAVSSAEFIDYVKKQLPGALEKTGQLIDANKLQQDLTRWQSDFFTI